MSTWILFYECWNFYFLVNKNTNHIYHNLFVVVNLLNGQSNFYYLSFNMNVVVYANLVVADWLNFSPDCLAYNYNITLAFQD